MAEVVMNPTLDFARLEWIEATIDAGIELSFEAGDDGYTVRVQRVPMTPSPTLRQAIDRAMKATV